MAVQTATDDQPVAVPPLEPAAAAPARVSPEQSAGPEESIKSTSEQRAGPAPVKSIEPTPERGSVPDVSSAEAAPAAAPPADIEQIFARLRQDAATGTTDQVAHIAYTRGLALLDAGDATGGIEQLQAAARSLRYRFDAGVRLAREHERRHRLNDAIDWLGRALEATPDAADARYDTLLHLATLLEQEGESARALATCLELQADAGSYRDVDARIARLTREQAGG
jgi:tetratricopeptide (TPR) repeat protein